MSAVENERVKLTATWLNTVAAGSVVVGVLAPMAGLAYGATPLDLPLSRLAVLAAAWIAFGVALHLLARWSLGRLRP